MRRPVEPCVPLPGEEWRDVNGYGGMYRVSNLGRVWKTAGKRAGVMLGGTAKGYRLVLFRYEKRRRGFTVHSLVAEAFIGPRPSGAQVRHLDGDKLNNAAYNLAWGTPVENSADRVLHGTALLGESNPRAKLSWSQVREIRSLVRISRHEIARRYGMGRTTISAILDGKSWKEAP